MLLFSLNVKFSNKGATYYFGESKSTLCLKTDHHGTLCRTTNSLLLPVAVESLGGIGPRSLALLKIWESYHDRDWRDKVHRIFAPTTLSSSSAWEQSLGWVEL